MIELRYFDGVLQYRNLLSDDAKLSIQSQVEADLAVEYESWKNVRKEFSNLLKVENDN